MKKDNIKQPAASVWAYRCRAGGHNAIVYGRVPTNEGYRTTSWFFGATDDDISLGIPDVIEQVIMPSKPKGLICLLGLPKSLADKLWAKDPTQTVKGLCKEGGKAWLRGYFDRINF